MNYFMNVFLFGVIRKRTWKVVIIKNMMLCENYFN